MKLIRFGEVGREKPGVLLEDGTRLDASGFGANYDEEFFANGGLAKLRNWLAKQGGSALHVRGSVRLGPPICRPTKIVCIASAERTRWITWPALRCTTIIRSAVFNWSGEGSG